MPRFLAEHKLPYSTEAEVLAFAKQMKPKIPKGFSWKLTYCDFGSHKFFCEWDAPSKEALAQAFKENSVPFDAIYPAKVFNAGKMGFEG
jgi:hypothetical protein